MASQNQPNPSGGARQDAQRRADQVAAFGRELVELERDGVLALGPEDRGRIERHHADLLATLARQFDVDRTESQRQMTLGMRAASLIGAVTLSAGIVLFFYRFWGLLTTPLQLAVLAGVRGLDLVHPPETAEMGPQPQVDLRSSLQGTRAERSDTGVLQSFNNAAGRGE